LITARGSTVKGLVINRFFDGIEISGNGGNTIQGCYLGTDVTGTLDLGNLFFGVRLLASNNLIGGITAAERNIISGNNIGIEISVGASSNQVKGNFIGTDVTGTLALGNDALAVVINDADNNLIGGTTPGDRNLISGNGAGVRIQIAF